VCVLFLILFNFLCRVKIVFYRTRVLKDYWQFDYRQLKTLKNTIDFAADDHRHIIYQCGIERSEIAHSIIYIYYNCIPSDFHTSFGVHFNTLRIYIIISHEYTHFSPQRKHAYFIISTGIR